MELTTLWFVLIAVLWTGYFVLEGFDFGVGMLLPVIGKSEAERRAMITTLGPLWTATRCGSWSPVVRPSRPSPSGTQPCSAASTCRCSSSSWR